MKMPGSERPPVPADPLLAGLVAGPTAALNRVQAQRGIRGNLSTCLDNPPSATEWKASCPSTSHHIGPKCKTYGGKKKLSPSSSEGTRIAKQD